MSVRVSSAGWGDDAVHAQAFHHLAVVIEGVGDAEFGAMQTRGLGLAYGCSMFSTVKVAAAL